ncbi:MAG: phosphatase PAP2 family protein [Paludibacter sp.]|nr:phosphatase PAP2 family protein [Bacteroidales bacterium]MCM1068916.1 phosphatase PAP2 family protein [Prevotella sp.]MCM1353177.1 phosphatase PAP2 family protein [Bacteroides sp.]MCM1442499.1 phosphatase PAP2 family protein [Muribaculum sp.]MCM1481342.1 phosphatase PAP2 family protein [Paludibacter sp.]
MTLLLQEGVFQMLLQADAHLLVLINQAHTVFLDTFLWNISQRLTWLPLYILLIAAIVRRYGKYSIGIILAFGICIGLADYISSGIIKNVVERLRPTHEPMLQGLLHSVRGYKGGLYGFVSSHAANTWCCTLLFALIWRNWRVSIPLVLWTLLNCWSRMYLGAHYPGDIIGGLLVGTVLALSGYWCLCKSGVLKKGETSVPPLWNYSIAFVCSLTLVFCCFI